jgi:hypothetical protein
MPWNKVLLQKEFHKNRQLEFNLTYVDAYQQAEQTLNNHVLPQSSEPFETEHFGMME